MNNDDLLAKHYNNESFTESNKYNNNYGVEKVKKIIDEIVANINSKPGKAKEKKDQIKEIKKIHRRLKQRGMAIIKLYGEDEVEFWYCGPCRKKQPVKYPHLITHRSNEKLFRGFCKVCSSELLKKDVKIILRSPIKDKIKNKDGDR